MNKIEDIFSFIESYKLKFNSNYMIFNISTHDYKLNKLYFENFV